MKVAVVGDSAATSEQSQSSVKFLSNSCMFMFNCRTKSVKAASSQDMKVAVVGGSLGGLAAANVLLRLGASVSVFEKSSHTFENCGACLGFVDVDMLQRIRGAKFMRNGRRASLDQGAFYYGDVWQFLYSGLPEGCVKFGHTVDTLGNDVEKPTIGGEVFDLAIIADGGWSTLREQCIDSGKQPEYTGHQIYWASVDTSELPGGLSSFDSEFGSTETATYSTGIYDAVILEAPKCNGSRMYACGFFIATPESEIRLPERGDNRQVSQVRSTKAREPDWFLPFVRHFFGKYVNGEIMRFSEAASSKGKISPNPVFEFAVSKTVTGRIVVLGDAAHLSTPWTAAGAHTAFLDAEGLYDVFASGGVDIDRALKAYNKGGVQRAHALLRQSRACSKRLIPRQGKHAIPSPATLVNF
mmetsp:Transcript_691/g.1258  ORF Transcript_691/g.1258 Transcript_691/m.1258 type:complete len:412 (-) Transcript_691:397-1632(-)